ncbi:hypothetical protein niasHS_003659 [Heterodera schachtii]|uniref:Uncharacterized protein n=1 Tax=Heterodera schachtii TaxID=97005 RepID=A0ABD2KHX0_HETSC
MRSNGGKDYTEGNGHAKKSIARFSKLKICSDISRLGEYGICSIQTINKGRNCLVFSVATRTDLKFETEIAERLDKCKVRVYDHEAKATNSDGTYRVIEKMDAKSIDEKMLKKIIDTEKGKIHVLRLEAGDKGTELTKSKVFKDRSVCHLLLTIYNTNISKLESLLNSMEKEQGYKLYSIKELKNEEADNEQVEKEEEENEEEEGEKEANDGLREEEEEAGRHYALSLIGQQCQKSYGIK